MSKPSLMAQRCVEFMKLMRTPRSAAEASQLMGWTRQAGYAWFQEFADNGLIVPAGMGRRARKGPTPVLYVLSPQWGGPVEHPIEHREAA